jgi:hypothetical protein
VNAIALALLLAALAVALAYYYFASAVEAASRPPQEPSVLCAVAAARGLWTANATGPCVLDSETGAVIYLSPSR